MNWYDAMEEAYKKGYEQGLKDACPKWIPVTERLPELECYIYSVDVLFCVHDGTIFVGYVNFETGTWKCLHSRELFVADKVTHWMPLPEPPKEADHGSV